MPLFSLEVEKEELPWKREDSAAVVACCNGYTALLEYIGFGIERQIEMNSDSRDTSFLGLDNPPEDGLWMWEGDYEWVENGYYDTDGGYYETVGEWRKLTDVEVERLRNGKPIWNLEDWYTDTALAKMRVFE